MATGRKPLRKRRPRLLRTRWPLRVRQVTPEAIEEAAAVLRGGGLVAFPTETVYGLGARGLRPEEVAKIFVAKGRPTGHPVILHVDGEPMARTLARSWPEIASRLTQELWPGPLTLVVERSDRVPAEVSGGLPSVGIRMPRHPVALALISAVGEPLAAPSANAHTHVSPTTAEHVVRSLGDRVDLVLDGGPCQHGIESTVVTLTESPPRVLRPGAVSLERLQAIAPGMAYEAISITTDVARASPGLASKHYAPKTRVRIVPLGGVTPGTIGAIVISPVAGEHVIRLPDDAEGYASGLFAALHTLDALGLSSITIEDVPDEPTWWAVRDRLKRAATS